MFTAVQWSAQEFADFILPPLSLPKRGPQGKLGYPNPCNSILKILYPGMQWKEVPIDKGPEGQVELPYTGVCNLFARWAEEGSLERAFRASVQHRAEALKLALSLLPGDGAKTVAKKGARPAGRGAPHTRRGRK